MLVSLFPNKSLCEYDDKRRWDSTEECKYLNYQEEQWALENSENLDILRPKKWPNFVAA